MNRISFLFMIIVIWFVVVTVHASQSRLSLEVAAFHTRRFRDAVFAGIALYAERS